MATVRIGSYKLNLPGNRIVRIAIGVLLILGGFIGFLPILGFWMVPAGLIILSADFPIVRRWNRRATVAIMRWWAGFRQRPWVAGLLRRFGFEKPATERPLRGAE